MTQAWRDHGLTIVVALLFLPVLAGAALVALTRHRGGTASARRQSLAEVGMVAGTLPWLVMTFTPQPAAGGVNLVPLRDLAAQAGEPGTLIAQVTGNLLVLAAFGFFAPIRWRVLGTPGRLFAAAAAASVAVELNQYLLDVGRVSSVDDVLLNAVGAVLAGLVSRRWWRSQSGRRNRVPAPGATPVA